MSSVVSNTKCPQCRIGVEAIRDYNCRTDAYYMFCPMCGYNEGRRTLRDRKTPPTPECRYPVVRDKNGFAVLRSYNRATRGAVKCAGLRGAVGFFSLKHDPSRALLARYDRSVAAGEIDPSQSWVTRFDPDSDCLHVLRGSLMLSEGSLEDLPSEGRARIVSEPAPPPRPGRGRP